MLTYTLCNCTYLTIQGLAWTWPEHNCQTNCKVCGNSRRPKMYSNKKRYISFHQIIVEAMSIVQISMLKTKRQCKFNFKKIFKHTTHLIFNLFLDSALNWQFGGYGSKVPISSESNYPAGRNPSAVHSSSCLEWNVNLDVIKMCLRKKRKRWGGTE